MAEHVEEATGQIVAVKGSKKKRKREKQLKSSVYPPLINFEDGEPSSKRVK